MKLSSDMQQKIMVDIRNDAMKIQQIMDRNMMSNQSSNERLMDYKDCEMLLYIIRTMESRARFVTGYDR